MLISGHFVWRETPLNSRFSRIKAQEYRRQRYLYTRIQKAQLTLFLFFIAFAQKNRDYTHVIANKKNYYTCGYATQTQDKPTHALMSTTRTTKPHLHSYRSHTKQKLHSRTMPPTRHKSHIFTSTITLKSYKTKRFTAKSQDFLSFWYTNSSYTSAEQCHISSETTLKSHGKTHRKSTFKSPNCIEKHTDFEQSIKNIEKPWNTANFSIKIEKHF